MVEKNWLLKRAIKESVEDNTTENQRYFIHRINFDLIKNNFFLGVGPGNYSKEHWQESKKVILKEEILWYELFITPRGHAHHDFLHFQAIGGFISSSLFVLFWALLLYKFFEETEKEKTILLAGLFSIFPAGFFQCYFQDDEVVLPFYILAGFLLSVTSNGNTKYKTKNFIFSIFFIILPLVVSISLLYFSTRKDPSSVHKRKIKTENIHNIPKIRKLLEPGTDYQIMKKEEARKGFTIEGCLTHRFTFPITPRKNEFAITLEYPRENQHSLGNLKITAFERDSFDQDKLYKVHRSNSLREYRIKLKNGKHKIFLTGLLSEKNSDDFPENIYLRDFQFQFEDFEDEEILLPKIVIGKDCDGE